VSWGGQADATVRDEEDDNRLINYIETNEISSYEEFVGVISSLSPESADSMEAPESITDFRIEVDYDNMFVLVTTLGDSSYGRSTGTRSTATKSYYTSDGTKVFTVKVEGSFAYTSGSCTTLSATGSFSRETLILWTSTPNITRGNISVRVAFAKISGVATCGTKQMSYSLTLTCDEFGHFTNF